MTTSSRHPAGDASATVTYEFSSPSYPAVCAGPRRCEATATILGVLVPRAMLPVRCQPQEVQ